MNKLQCRSTRIDLYRPLVENSKNETWESTSSRVGGCTRLTTKMKQPNVHLCSDGCRQHDRCLRGRRRGVFASRREDPVFPTTSHCTSCDSPTPLRSSRRNPIFVIIIDYTFLPCPVQSFNNSTPRPLAHLRNLLIYPWNHEKNDRPLQSYWEGQHLSIRTVDDIDSQPLQQVCTGEAISHTDG